MVVVAYGILPLSGIFIYTAFVFIFLEGLLLVLYYVRMHSALTAVMSGSL